MKRNILIILMSMVLTSIQASVGSLRHAGRQAFQVARGATRNVSGTAQKALEQQALTRISTGEAAQAGRQSTGELSTSELFQQGYKKLPEMVAEHIAAQVAPIQQGFSVANKTIGQGLAHHITTAQQAARQAQARLHTTTQSGKMLLHKAGKTFYNIAQDGISAIKSELDVAKHELQTAKPHLKAIGNDFRKLVNPSTGSYLKPSSRNIIESNISELPTGLSTSSTKASWLERIKDWGKKINSQIEAKISSLTDTLLQPYAEHQIERKGVPLVKTRNLQEEVAFIRANLDHTGTTADSGAVELLKDLGYIQTTSDGKGNEFVGNVDRLRKILARLSYEDRHAVVKGLRHNLYNHPSSYIDIIHSLPFFTQAQEQELQRKQQKDREFFTDQLNTGSAGISHANPNEEGGIPLIRETTPYNKEDHDEFMQKIIRQRLAREHIQGHSENFENQVIMGDALQKYDEKRQQAAEKLIDALGVKSTKEYQEIMAKLLAKMENPSIKKILSREFQKLVETGKAVPSYPEERLLFALEHMKDSLLEGIKDSKELYPQSSYLQLWQDAFGRQQARKEWDEKFAERVKSGQASQKYERKPDTTFAEHFVRFNDVVSKPDYEEKMREFEKKNTEFQKRLFEENFRAGNAGPVFPQVEKVPSIIIPPATIETRTSVK